MTSLKSVKSREAGTDAQPLAPTERPFGILDELERVRALSYVVETPLLSRVDMAVPMVTMLDARARMEGVRVTVKGTSPFTATTLAWPAGTDRVVLLENPTGNEGHVIEFTTEAEVNTLLRSVVDEAEDRGVAVGPIGMMTTFLQNTMLNTLQHGGGRGHAAVCLRPSAIYGCVCDAGPGIARTLSQRFMNSQEAVGAVLNGMRRGGLSTVANYAYRSVGSKLTLRSGPAELQLAAEHQDSLEVLRFLARPAIQGTYAALSVPHETGR